MSSNRTHAWGRRLLLAEIVIVVTASCALGDGTAPPDSSPVDATPTRAVRDLPASAYATQLEALVSGARQDSGIDPLEHDDCAGRVAAERAKSLVGAEDLTHGDLDDVLEECDVVRAGENLARSERPPDEVVDAWLSSPGHASNIRDQGFDRGAVACVEDGQVDGKPQMLCSHIFLEGSEPGTSS